MKPGEEPPPPDDVLDQIRPLLPPPEARPRVILRFADEKNLLVAGMLAGGKELANRPALIDVPLGKGHVLLFNAVLNYDHLDAGR